MLVASTGAAPGHSPAEEAGHRPGEDREQQSSAHRGRVGMDTISGLQRSLERISKESEASAGRQSEVGGQLWHLLHDSAIHFLSL